MIAFVIQLKKPLVIKNNNFLPPQSENYSRSVFPEKEGLDFQVPTPTTKDYDFQIAPRWKRVCLLGGTE